MKFNSNILFLSMVFCFTSFSAQADTLKQAVVAALNNHPSVHEALASKDIAEQTTREAKSGLYPEISINAAGGRLYADNSTTRGLVVTRGEAYSYLWEGSAAMSQMIYDGNETKSRIGAAKAREDSALLNISDAREQLALRTASSYINVMRTREALLLLESYMPRISDYQSRIKKMVDKGASDKGELAQARNIRLQLEDIVLGYRNDYNKAIAEYYEVIGEMPDEHMTKPTPNLTLIPASIEEGINYALNNHPAISSLEYTEKAALYDVDAAESALIPNLDGELSYLKRDQREEIGGEVIDARAVVRMNWNFSTGGAELARIKSAKYQSAEARAQKEAQRRAILRDIKIANGTVELTTQRAKLSAARLEAAKELYETQKKQFEAAKITQIQLMQTENSYVNAQLYKLNSDFRHLISQFQMLASLGRLQESLEIPVPKTNG